MLTEPIADLHCDLLMALAMGRTPYDPETRCSHPQMQSGHVRWQLLPLFVETGPRSVAIGEAQAQAYKDLFRLHFRDFHRGWTHLTFSAIEPPEKIQVWPAIENASAFCTESEPLEKGLARLDQLIESIGKPAYVSLTWKHENRFGGGNEAKVGLKPDGLVLVERLHELGIAVDLSHTSDALADDLLSIDKNIAVIASHSNFRTVLNHSRNLPDAIALEVVARGGVIGLNGVRHFVGEELSELASHIEHAIHIGCSRSLCWGVDFFLEEGLASDEDYFFPGLSDSSSFPSLLIALRRRGLTNKSFLSDLCYRNAHRWIAGRM